jgi:hypothetical protein
VEDDCWSVEALRDVNSLAAYLPLKDEFKEREKMVRLSFVKATRKTAHET